MEKYIPLDALITEIKMLDSLYHTSKDLSGDLFIQGLFCFLDTTEVKDVDLENIAAAEWDDYVRKIDGEPDTAYMLIKRNEYIELAKHFFELILKAQKEK